MITFNSIPIPPLKILQCLAKMALMEIKPFEYDPGKAVLIDWDGDFLFIDNDTPDILRHNLNLSLSMADSLLAD